MDFPKVAVVTGGGRGIGAAISSRLAADGFAVAVNYSRSARDAEEVVAKIVADGGRAVAIRADISQAAEAERLIADTTVHLGAPTVVVNNAGMNKAGAARKQSPEDFDEVIAVNLNGAFYCTHFALPAMYEAGWGRVIFVNSPSGGRRPSPGMSAYSAAKAGLVGMAKSMALEVARRGVTVNCVMPGFVATDIVASGGEAGVEALTKHWPSIPPESIASTISFLVSDNAADVSGEEIGVWRGGPVGV
ncbi:SDR family NAD(P)-dependent oxidoreductase [Rhodococcus oxybenzonivorans]|uniref:SDR family oxidoreductase n=1 Tax=Rhodococcus TaxID=1827 RepID=UPI00131FF242|nr:MULTISPECIES: SDR family NAD(P)-dependent oxidoreductase [Rhodococcus]MDV7352834.1 SDR family NAD(P)-dependent oxidoreductase [Rhodococcus oxybenzonivorans]QHE70499.1 3-oxoacyl-[acyl-carrier protein] reductase [Rhodococcus sp. WAY2]